MWSSDLVPLLTDVPFFQNPSRFGSILSSLSLEGFSYCVRAFLYLLEQRENVCVCLSSSHSLSAKWCHGWVHFCWVSLKYRLFVPACLNVWGLFKKIWCQILWMWIYTMGYWYFCIAEKCFPSLLWDVCKLETFLSFGGSLLSFVRKDQNLLWTEAALAQPLGQCLEEALYLLGGGVGSCLQMLRRRLRLLPSGGPASLTCQVPATPSLQLFLHCSASPVPLAVQDLSLSLHPRENCGRCLDVRLLHSSLEAALRAAAGTLLGLTP